MRKGMARFAVVGLSLASCLALIGAGAGASSAAVASRIAATGWTSVRAHGPDVAGPCTGWTSAAITHVIVLVEENQSESIVKKASMPYLKSLTKQCGLATNAHNLTHPSTGNYLGLTSGQVQGNAWSHDGGPGNYPQAQESLFHQIDQAGKSWGVYAQSMPTPCDRSNSGVYYVRHTAAPYFNDINGLGGSLDNSCQTNDLPLGDSSPGAGNNLYSALYDNGGAGLPAFSLVAPDVCHDLHGQKGACSGGQLYANADQFLQTWVGLIVASPNYVAGNTALVITWDEGAGSDETSPEACWAETIPGKQAGGKPSCWIADLVVSARTGAGTRSATAYNHYDLLAAFETLLGLPLLPNNPSVSGSPDGTAATFLSDFGLN
jgi:phosphatidylinositol-3-phosphatase